MYVTLVFVQNSRKSHMYQLQNHENDYSYWQSRQSEKEDRGPAQLNHRDRSTDNRDEDQSSYKEIYTYPLLPDYYDLNADQQMSYQLK